MDASLLDHDVRAWAEAGARRPVLGLLAGSAVALAGLTETSGKRKKKKKVTLCLNGQTISVPKKKQGSYLSQGATTGKCPGACVPQCAGKTCGPDGCGGSCGACPGDKTCQGGNCACPPGELDDCGSDICVPPGSVCCTDGNCSGIPGRRCRRGQCVTWEGNCPAGADSCSENVAVPCNSGCSCYKSTEGDTRCGGSSLGGNDCERCTTTADCVAQFPNVPGVFCKQGEGNACGCPGTCVQPCPPPF